MKTIYKLGLIGAMLLFATPQLMAQAQVGIRVGGANTMVFSPQVHTGDARVGASLGGFVDVHVLEGLTVRPEVSLTWKGGHASRISNNREISAALTVAEMPVLVRYRASVGERFAPSVYGGPYLGVIIAEEIRDGSLPHPFARDIEAGFMVGLDFALLRGGGLFFDSKPREIGLGARYTHGLTDFAATARVVLHSRTIGLALFMHL